MRVRAGLFMTVAVALTAAWVLLVYLPHKRAVARVKKETAATNAETAQVREFLVELPSYLQARKELESRRIDLNSRLYAKGEILRLFDRLTHDAENHSLKVREISPPVEELLKLNAAMPESNQPLFLNITLRLSGRYRDFGEFTADLEQSEYFRGINRCVVNAGRNRSDPLELMVGFKAILGATG